MAGLYIFPQDFLKLSGGTVTGFTEFTSGVLASDSLSANTIFSGSSNIEDIFNKKIVSAVTSADFLPLSGGIGGEYYLTGITTGDTIEIKDDIKPNVNEGADIGSPVKRFRSLRVKNGVTEGFTANTANFHKIYLDNREMTGKNIALTGDVINGGFF